MKSARSRKGIGGSRIVVACGAALAAGAFELPADAAVIGFGGNAMTGWQPNANAAAVTAGVPNVSGPGDATDVLQLTTATNGLATSYWYATPQDITNWVANFTYTDVSTGGADGITFTMQNQGTGALGGGGGALGYVGITNAAGDAFNIYGGNSGSGSQFNPTISAGGVPLTPTKSTVNIASGHPMNVTLSYNQADHAVVETITDSTTSASQTRVFRNVDLPTLVGGSNTALIGFTGATGGVNANQNVRNFTFTNGSAPAAPVPSFTPLAVTGFSQNMVVSLAGGTSTVTATMDGGSAKTGNTFYEKGVSTANPATGLPNGGQVFGSGTDADHTFAFQNFSAANNAILLDNSTNSASIHPTGTLTLTTPSHEDALSFLVSSGNGTQSFTATIHFAGGAPDEVHTGIPAPDWFNSSPIAFDANGRETLAGAVANVGSGNPRIYQEDVTLLDKTDLITGIDFTYTGDAVNGHTAIFGVSGAVPEPVSALPLAMLAASGLVRRRARRRRQTRQQLE
jgi:Bacterial lectin